MILLGTLAPAGGSDYFEEILNIQISIKKPPLNNEGFKLKLNKEQGTLNHEVPPMGIPCSLFIIRYSFAVGGGIEPPRGS